MNERQIYRGTVRTGRGGGIKEMSKPGELEDGDTVEFTLAN